MKGTSKRLQLQNLSQQSQSPKAVISDGGSSNLDVQYISQGNIDQQSQEEISDGSVKDMNENYHYSRSNSQVSSTSIKAMSMHKSGSQRSIHLHNQKDKD